MHTLNMYNSKIDQVYSMLTQFAILQTPVGEVPF